MTATPEQIAAAAEAASAAHAQHARLLRAAHANPTPGELAGAFDLPPDPPSPGVAALARLGLSLRPVVAADFLLLKRLNSPLYRHAEKAADAAQAGDAAAPTGHTDDELAEMIYQFTAPVREVRAVLLRGRAAFTDAAWAATLDRLHPTELTDVLDAVVANFTGSFATALAHRDPTPEGEQRVDFSPASQAPATALAGGSPTAPCSPENTTGRLTT